MHMVVPDVMQGHIFVFLFLYTYVFLPIMFLIVFSFFYNFPLIFYAMHLIHLLFFYFD
jgi:hypothetical protein